MSETTRLTGGEYWDAGYGERASSAPLRIDDFRNLGDRRIVEAVERIGLAGKRVLEVGAGNSAILTHLAGVHRSGTTFTGLDYSEAGCELLRARAAAERVPVQVVHADLFAPAPELVGAFDVVYSLGVVEHFGDLGAVMRAMGRFLVPGGRMMTLIPNMAGILGTLTKRYNRRVYDLHVPHDLTAFRAGHEAAGLIIERAGYLCSTNFGVLSSCFTSPADAGWTTYKWLSRVSKFLWMVEGRVGDLPHSAWLSPYIVITSRTPE